MPDGYILFGHRICRGFLSLAVFADNIKNIDSSNRRV